VSFPQIFRLDNEIALITGGGTGLGLAMATRMAEAGARVVITGRREDVLKESVASIGTSASYFVHDVADLSAAPKLIDDIAASLGAGPSILVNNAGHNLKKFAMDTTEQEMIDMLNTHVTGAFALARAAAKGMIEKKHGSILFTASMGSLFAIPQVVAYSTAKTAILGMMRVMALELSGQGVRVNAIAPGWIDSAMLRKAFAGDPARAQRVLQRTPMNTLGAG
jgi:gluconate 5-dehydrogenase